MQLLDQGRISLDGYPAHLQRRVICNGLQPAVESNRANRALELRPEARLFRRRRFVDGQLRQIDLL